MPKIKRKLKYLHLGVAKVEDYDYHIQSDQTKSVIFSNVLESIKHGITDNKQKVELFMVDEGKSIITLHKNDWVHSLKAAIKFYSHTSEFERCIDCQELLNLVVPN